MSESIQTSVEKRLSIIRETELLHSFVRVNVGDEDEFNEEDKGDDEGSNQNQQKKSEESETKNKIGSERPEKVSSKSAQPPKARLKKRRRKNGIRHEEVYCDKDRAAAVNLGSKDIKQSLKLKRKQDRTRIMQIPEEAEPGTFLALGNYEMTRGDLNIAINFIGKVINLDEYEKIVTHR